MTTRRDELKAFLRARRAALTPAAIGLAEGRRRKTPGLRREEVASIADVGVTWYTWLEQGREIRMSREALERIAHALRLSSSDAAYLFALAGVERRDEASEPTVDPVVKLVVDSIDCSPAFVIDPRTDVVAFNRLADKVYRFDTYGGRFGRNHVWRLFGDPSRKSLYADSWDRVADSAVGIVRANYASRIGDPGLEELLAALRETGREFTDRWKAQYTAPVSQTLPVTFVRKDLGRIAMFSTRLSLPDHPGHVVFILPPADTRTERFFRRFAQTQAQARADTRRASDGPRSSKR